MRFRTSHDNAGFTLIELVLVITILGILAVVAIPQFADLRQQALVSARDGVAGSVRSAIGVTKAGNLAAGTLPYAPATLDAAAAGATASAAAPFFTNVLSDAVTDSRWTKDAADATIYVFDATGLNTRYDYNPDAAGNGRNATLSQL